MVEMTTEQGPTAFFNHKAMTYPDFEPIFIVIPPPRATPSDITRAQDTAKNLAEQMQRLLVLPQGWEVSCLQRIGVPRIHLPTFFGLADIEYAESLLGPLMDPTCRALVVRHGFRVSFIRPE